MQVLVYLGTILVMVGLMQWSSAGKRPAPAHGLTPCT